MTGVGLGLEPGGGSRGASLGGLGILAIFRPFDFLNRNHSTHRRSAAEDLENLSLYRCHFTASSGISTSRISQTIKPNSTKYTTATHVAQDLPKSVGTKIFLIAITFATVPPKAWT